jgi:hypothetical protein
MRSSKNRSRSKSNRQRSLGNIINRVFDSSGPESKVRGTPQQIIEKYLMLARDAQLSNDRVAEQNFLQHAEHYTRMLSEAQREMAREQEGRQGQPGQGQPGQGQQGQGQGQGGQGQGGYGGQGYGGQTAPAAPSGAQPETDEAEPAAESGYEAASTNPEGGRNGARPARDTGDDRGRRDTGDDRGRRDNRAPRSVMMPALGGDDAEDGPGLVETPEGRRQDSQPPTTAGAPRTRAERAPKPIAAAVDGAATDDAASSARKPARGPRKPRNREAETAIKPTDPAQ